MALPTLTAEQRADALAKAAAVRTARAQVKEQLRAGPQALREVLARAHEDEVVGRMKVSDALGALPGIGAAKCAAIMGQVGIAPTRRLRGLGPKQVQALLELVDR